MSKSTGHRPRHNPAGKHVHECAYCGVTFRSNRASTKYCCFAHKQAKGNQQFYSHHRKQVILGVMLRQTRKAKPQPRRKSVSAVSFDEMTEDELIAYIQKNPGMVNRGK